MTRLLLFLVLLFGATPAAAQARGVADPRAFVASVYAQYQAHPDRPSRDLRYAYSPSLRRLFTLYDAWQRRHHGEVGALDFDWWTNAQDWELSNLRLTQRNEGRDRRWIIARFDNAGRHDEVRFRFVRQGARWYLEDAVQGTGSGDNGWTLSALLRRREQ